MAMLAVVSARDDDGFHPRPFGDEQHRAHDPDKATGKALESHAGFADELCHLIIQGSVDALANVA